VDSPRNISQIKMTENTETSRRKKGEGAGSINPAGMICKGRNPVKLTNTLLGVLLAAGISVNCVDAV
jgi:hypothetical protein